MRYFLILLVVTLIFVLPSVAGAQVAFEKWYGGNSGDYGYSVAQTTDGGYIIAGKTRSYGAGSYDVYLIKTDSIGDTLWTRTYGDTCSDVGSSVVQTTDGGYVIAGRTKSFGVDSSDVYLIKTNSTGDTSWTRTYGGTGNDYGYSVAQTTDGGYIITGSTSSYGAGLSDVYLIKTNSSGDTSWTKAYGGTYRDVGRSVVQTTDGGYIIAGWTCSFGAWLSDVYLIKTDSIGDTLWTKTYGDSASDYGNSVIQTTDGGYIIAGWAEPFGRAHNDVYLVKTNSVGDTLWTKLHFSGTWSSANSIAQTTDRGYIIAGSVLTFDWSDNFYNDDVYLMKTDSIGDTLWTRTYGDTCTDGGCSVAQTTDGGYIIAGYRESYDTGSYDVYLIKTDTLGNSGIEEEKDIGPKTTNIKLLAYPNPFTTSTTITFIPPSTAQSAKGIGLKIYDVSGRLVKFIPLTTDHLLLGADLTPGVYFLNLEGRNVGKVIKVR